MKKKLVFILIAFFGLLFGLFVFIMEKEQGDEVLRTFSLPEEEKVTIYIPELQKTEKNIIIVKGKKDQEKARIIIEELKKKGILPEETELYEMAKGRDTLYLNFSKHLFHEIEDPFDEIRRIYGIVNSFLSTFSYAKAVQILVEDEPVYTLSGLIYTYKPLKFNETLEEE